MALIDKASLLMVPSTYEAGTLYNVLPSGNRAPDSTDQNSGYDQTRADFSFDRGSNAAATRVNADGLIEKYRENLLTYSNAFNQWGKVNSSVTSGQSGYDDSNDAWLLTATSAGPRIQFSISKSGVNTFSIYAKAGSVNWLRLLVIGTSNYARYFDLENGVTGGSVYSTEVDSKITDIGNGWYRCSITTNISTSEVRVYLADSDGTQSTTSAGNIYIQNAQLESGLVATDYLDSGATTAKAGVLIDLPRINYDANGENGALLLEPSRLNKIQYSEYFEGSYWTKSNLSITTNNATSPSGFGDSSLITLSAGNLVKQFYSGSFTAITNDYAFSGFFKKGTHNFVQLLAGPTDIVNFDLTLGTYNSPSLTLGDIEDYGNGWYRCTMLASGSGSSITVVNVLAVDSLSSTRAQSTSSTGDFYAWGFQVEQNATYQSSYIPNMGESGGVTRAADSCSVTGVSDVIGQTEGTLFVEFEYSNNSVGVVSIHSGNIGNRVYIGTDANGLISQVRVGYAQQAFFSTSLTIGTTYKCAIAYKANDFALYVNGSQIGTDTSGSVPSSMLKLGFESGAGGDVLNQPTKQTMLFKERLSNAELAALTA